MISQEKMRDYLMRGEEFKLNLTDVVENVSEKLLWSDFLKNFAGKFCKFCNCFQLWQNVCIVLTYLNVYMVDT